MGRKHARLFDCRGKSPGKSEVGHVGERMERKGGIFCYF